MRPVECVNSDERLSLAESSVIQCISAIDSWPGICLPTGSIEVAFVDEESCSRLHQAFFDDPDVTDVMTFPGDPEDAHAGDVAICPIVAWTASMESGLPFHEELTLYLAHACLHLAGFDDRDEEDIKQMRSGEDKIMQHLRNNNSLLQAVWIG